VTEAMQRAAQLGSVPAQVMIADDLMHEGRIGSALRMLEATCKQDPGNAEPAYALAVLLQHAGQPARAAELLRGLPDPGEGGARFLASLGNVWFDAGDFAKAGQLFGRASAACSQQEADLRAELVARASTAREHEDMAS